jgi:hypothetical protein
MIGLAGKRGSLLSFVPKSLYRVGTKPNQLADSLWERDVRI